MNELVKIEDGKIIIADEFVKAYAEFQKQALEMDLKAKEVKQVLKEKMEEYGITGFENDYLKVTYTKPTTRTTVDSKRLKDELPDIYEEYSKTSNVSSSIKMEVKC